MWCVCVFVWTTIMPFNRVTRKRQVIDRFIKWMRTCDWPAARHIQWAWPRCGCFTLHYTNYQSVFAAVQVCCRRTTCLVWPKVRAEPLRAEMAAEPIRSALGTVSKEDTSLVLPSDRKQRTGQQRVLEQVKSIKRGKSKMVKSDSIPSPTSKCGLIYTCII